MKKMRSSNMSVSNITSKLGNKVKVFTKTVAVAAILHSPISSPAMTKALTSDVAKFSHTIDADVATTTMSKMMKKAAKFVGKSESSVPGDPPVTESYIPRTYTKETYVAESGPKLIYDKGFWKIFDITNDKKALDSLKINRSEVKRVLLSNDRLGTYPNLVLAEYEPKSLPNGSLIRTTYSGVGNSKMDSVKFNNGSLDVSVGFLESEYKHVKSVSPNGAVSYSIRDANDKLVTDLSEESYQSTMDVAFPSYLPLIQFLKDEKLQMTKIKSSAETNISRQAKTEAVSMAPAARSMKLIGQNAEYSAYDITNDKKALDSLSFAEPKAGESPREMVILAKSKKAGGKNITAVIYETYVIPSIRACYEKCVISGLDNPLEIVTMYFDDATFISSHALINNLKIQQQKTQLGEMIYTLTNYANKEDIPVDAKKYKKYVTQIQAPYKSFIEIIDASPEPTKLFASKEAARAKAMSESPAAPVAKTAPTAPAAKAAPETVTSPSAPKFEEGLTLLARDGDYSIFDLTKNKEVYEKLNLDSDAVKRIVFAVNNARDDASMVMVNYKLEKSSIGSRIKTTFSGLGETLEIDTVRLANGTKDILSFVDDGPAIVKSTSAKGIKKYLLNDPDKGQKFDLTLAEYQDLEKNMYSQYAFLMKHAKKPVQVKSAKEELMASIKSRGKSTVAKPATGPGHVFIATEGNFDISDVTKDKALLSKITGETRAAERALSFDNKAHADSSFYEVAYPNTSVVDDYGYKILTNKTYWIGDQSPTIILEHTSRDKVFKKYYTNKATGQTICETSVMGKQFYTIKKNALRQVDLTAEEFNKMKDEWLTPYSPLLNPADSEIKKPVARSSDAFDAFNLLMMHNQAINGLDQIVRDDAEFFRNLYGTTNPFIH